ncbi:MAG: TlpA family protein disulfide reductase [Aureispira sp.]
MKQFFLACLIGLLYACNSTTPSDNATVSSIQPGNWRATLNINTVDSPLLLPFNIVVVNAEDEAAMPTFRIQNGAEIIEATMITRDTADATQFTITLPVFNSTIMARLEDQLLVGQWHNHAKKGYRLPFKAEYGSAQRFLNTQAPSQPLAKRWRVTFNPNTPDAYLAIGLFEVAKDGNATGTFMTETGDYRYLAGHFDGHLLQLSCFDGAHAFLFKATLNEQGDLNGRFWSGNHWNGPWIASPNEDFQLTDMQNLTYLKEGYEYLEFAFPDINGDTIVYNSDSYQDKVTIVQISGSWCPNCMDASRFLGQLYQNNKNKGLHMVAIDYELENNFELFQTNEKKLRKDLNIKYPVLFGGAAKKTIASKTLPMLNKIISYPTSIFIDKKGKVRAIHTGFAGPSTGEIYTNYIKKTKAFVQELLAE